MLALALALAHVATPGPAVVILPLLADGTVSLKQAHGVTAQIRAAVDAGGFARALSTSSDDDKQAQTCQRDPKCFAKLAEVRGADLIAGGAVTPAADGLKVTLVVVRPGDLVAFRSVAATLQGNDGDGARLDRLARSAFNPTSLAGLIVVTGDEGATVEIDGKPAGTLPLDGPVSVVEGDHVVVVRHAGYDDLRRTLTVAHAATVDMKAVLLASAAGSSAGPPAAPGAAESAGLPLDVVVVGSIGAGLVVLGGVSGGLSLKDSLDVESRAQAQLLSFPADAALLARGQIEAYVADGLYAAGALALGGAAVLWLLAAPEDGHGA